MDKGADWICINTATWAQFLEALARADVGVGRTTAGNHPYLRRTVNGRVVTAPLPKGFDVTNPDASGRVGLSVFESVRRKLRIEDAYFKGWYRAFN